MYTIELIKLTRSKFFSLIDSLSVKEVNKIPTGFNNNIVWNFGHAVVSGYLLCYSSTKVNPSLQIPLVDKFKKGTKPETPISQEEINLLKKLSDDFIHQIESDIQKNAFVNIEPYTTQTFGVEWNTFDDVLITIFGHDVLHYSVAKTFQKII